LARLAPNGLLDATKDEAIISGWWTSYPNANIAIRCGEESGLVVLDIDAYRGGVYSFEDLESQHGRVPYSIRAKTGSGGGSSHIYLAHPRDGRRISSNASGKLGAGLDVKADGGYVVAPPSLHASGGRYIWLDTDNSHLEPAPAWLLNLLGSTNSAPENPINTGIELPEEDAKRLADEWFAKAALRVEAGSPRHDTWVWFVIQMKDSAVPIAVTAQYVDEFLHVAGELGSARNVTEQELRAALAWAYGKARRDPLPAARRALDDQRLKPKEPDEKPIASATTAIEPWINLDGLREELRQVARTRVSTGIPALDKATKGGLPGGAVTLLVGPVGSCKTALAVQLGITRSRALGKVCYAYMPDQGGVQPLARLAETYGDITDDDASFAQFCLEVGPVFRVFDERQTGVTLETFRNAVLAATDVGAVIIDTPQTVATKSDDDERRVIDLAMGVARELSSKLTTHALIPSHANRASTAARKKEDRTMERAAGLGSAKLEHRSQLVLFLERRDGEGEDPATEVDVLVAKASFGKAGARFRLVLDAARWHLSEIDFAADQAGDEARRENKIVERKATESVVHRDAILKIVDAEPDKTVGASLVRIKSGWGGRASELSETLALFVEDGVLEVYLGEKPKTGGRQPKLYRRKA
jgi:archaellum biogenesis ATPase FlaH